MYLCRARQSYPRVTEDRRRLWYRALSRIDRAQRFNWYWCSHRSKVNPFASCWMPRGIPQGWDVREPQDDFANCELNTLSSKRQHLLIGARCGSV
jgi:hypothetical protein